jgi:hypothetical protein
MITVDQRSVSHKDRAAACAQRGIHHKQEARFEVPEKKQGIFVAELKAAAVMIRSRVTPLGDLPKQAGTSATEPMLQQNSNA